jgi:hypothetical protein
VSKEFRFGRIRGHAGKLSDLPEVQAFAGLYMARGAGRNNVVNIRLSDEALARVDQLVEATLFTSRSEAAAFLIGAGIQSQQELFKRLGSHADEIRVLKEKLRQVALEAIKPEE